MQERLFEKLVGNLDEITKQYRTLLDCIRKEKDLLIKADVVKLNENNLLKEQTLFKIKSLDGLRMNYSSELAQLIKADHKAPRLLEMAQRMGGKEGETLRSFHSTLELIIKRVMELNKENAIYAESALKNVNAAMENIKETILGSQTTYKKKGNVQRGSESSGHLVSREA